MNCLQFLDRLDDIVAGSCPADERAAAERHAAACPSCRGLLDDVRRLELAAVIEEARPLEGAEAEELTAAVMGRTAGSACGRAEELLAELVFAASREARPAPADSDVARAAWLADPILAQHIEHCRSCAAVAEAMAVAAAALPSLAEEEPDPWFERVVLARTSRAPREDPFVAGVLAWWRRWAARPRFALELAYVATLLLVLVVGNPVEPLQAASRRTLTVAAASLERARTAWPAERTPSVVLASGEAMTGLRGEVAERQAGFLAAVERAWMQASQTWAATVAWMSARASSLLSAASDMWREMTRRVDDRAEPPAGSTR